jgi:ABC-type sugar transport system permease subunit
MTSASIPDLVTNNRRMRQRRRLSMEHSSFLFSILLILPSALLIGSIVVVPFFHVLLISLQSIEVGSLSGRFVGLANYKWAFSSSELHQAVIKSLV